jgi:hypothetical protein
MPSILRSGTKGAPAQPTSRGSLHPSRVRSGVSAKRRVCGGAGSQVRTAAVPFTSTWTSSIQGSSSTSRTLCPFSQIASRQTMAGLDYIDDFFCESLTLRIWGGENAQTAVSPRPPISLSRIVARAEGYTYAAKLWALCLVQGPFSVAPCQTLTYRFAFCAPLSAS